MELAHLLNDNRPAQRSDEVMDGHSPTWQNGGNGMNGSVPSLEYRSLDQSPQRPGAVYSGSAVSGPPKHVTFELLIPEAPQQRARLPMRVNIFPHDATDSIITTVKNFYGLYDGNGVSFEDKEGNTLIGRYENFVNRMTVYVRVVEDERSGCATPHISLSPSRPHLGPPIEMVGPMQDADGNHLHPASRNARPRSVSPTSGRRSASVSTNPKSRSRPGAKSRTGSVQGSFEAGGHYNENMSDSDGGDASVTSRRSKVTEVITAEISVENIVEGGRRKRARFDSSELPLFVPSQVPMPNSISSVSPQRRMGESNAASPYATNSYTFSYNQPLPSPQSRGYSDMGNGAYSQAFGNRELRARPAAIVARYGSGNGILPTPDPTVGSVISDEDVALQLMRLGEASNFSSHGRTSTSTLDDALSGKAEASDYSDDGSDADDEDPANGAGYSSDEGDGEDGLAYRAASVKSNGHGTGLALSLGHQKHMKPKMSIEKHEAPGSRKNSKTSKPKPRKSADAIKDGPISPASMPSQSRKASNASLTYGPDEEDLSAKPRCQRCRKSKKGCDRQRPCGRCKDAGIGIEGCVSEDEGNGRKGRYGRHMGVPIKKDDVPTNPNIMPTMHHVVPAPYHGGQHGHQHAFGHSPQRHSHSHSHSSGHIPMGPPTIMMGQKKRKR